MNLISNEQPVELSDVSIDTRELLNDMNTAMKKPLENKFVDGIGQYSAKRNASLASNQAVDLAEHVLVDFDHSFAAKSQEEAKESPQNSQQQ